MVKKISSCSLTIVLVQKIENYLKIKVKSINNIAEDEFYKNYEVSVNDAFGIEKFGSISDLTRPTFSNDINTLQVNYFSYSNQQLKQFDLSFVDKGASSKISVKVNGAAAREIANGIVTEIERLIKEYSNLNFLFHGNYTWIPLMLFSASFGILFGGVLNYKSTGTLISYNKKYFWLIRLMRTFRNKDPKKSPFNSRYGLNTRHIFLFVRALSPRLEGLSRKEKCAHQGWLA